MATSSAARRGKTRLARAATLSALGLPLLSLTGCPRASEPERRLTSASPPADAPPAGPLEEHPSPAPNIAPTASGLPALTGEWLERLEVDGNVVFVTPPLGAVEPRPLVVGVHGAGDRPDWACGGWRLAAQAGAFVVCPQGSPMGGQTFGWSSPQALAKRVDRAIAIARERYGNYIASGPMVYAGFSQGATFAEPFLRQNAARFPSVILAEGGYRTAQNPGFALAFREAGGRRVTLVCGGPSCFKSAIISKKVLERAGVETLVVGDERAGHNLNQRMQRALERSWSEITAPLPEHSAHSH